MLGFGSYTRPAASLKQVPAPHFLVPGMSAIGGIIEFDNRPVTAEHLHAMAASLSVQGPDGSAVYIAENAGLLHLAFNSTPESRQETQPLVSREKRFVLVADVRLDNRDELITKLGGRTAFPMETITDPDLLLRAYQRWSTACVEHLQGDFVFAVWDNLSRELFLARDPLGGFSVNYYEDASRFVFASTAGAILDLPFVSARVNEAKVTRVLANLPYDENSTFFEDVYYLPPAHCLTITGNSAASQKQWRYWKIDPDRRIRYRDEQEYAAHFVELLGQSLDARLRSCANVGISLSGGYDSTLLAALAAPRLSAGAGLKSFSYVFDRHTACDEREYIQPVVDRYTLDATFINGDDKWTFKNLSQQSVPRDFFWSNCFVQLPRSVASAAQQAGCGLLIDGEFGDALCAGSNLFAAEMIREGRIAALISLLREERKHVDWRRELITRGLRPLLPNWLRRGYRRLRPQQPTPFVTGLMPERLSALKQQSAKQQMLQEPDSRLNPAKRQRYGYLLDTSWSQGFATVRHEIDAPAGITRVSPYFDRRIIEFIMAIPAEQLNRPGHHRHLQQTAMQDLLPSLVYKRKTKTSYEPLLQQGLLNKERAQVRALLDHSLLVQQGWIDEAWLLAEVNADADWSMAGHPLSMCLHLELWLRGVEDASAGKVRWSTP